MRGCRVRESRSHGIQVDGTNTRVDRCSVQRAQGDGISLRADNTVLLRNRVQRSGEFGVYVREGGSGFVGNTSVGNGEQDLAEELTPGTGTDVYRRNGIGRCREIE